MIGRFARSWELAKASARVLRSDKELLLFPVMSAVAMLLVIASFAVPIFGSGVYERYLGAAGGTPPDRALLYVASFAFYVVQYTVIFFFNSALVGAAMIRLDGGDPTVSDGLRIARRKIVPILGYAVISATVGMVLRTIEEQAGFVGRIVIALIGATWAVATAMVVPVLVTRDVGPVDAVKESAGLLRRTWGENLIGNGGIGIVFGLLTVAAFLVGGALTVVALGSHMVPLVIACASLTVVTVLGLMLVQSTLNGIYSAALYRYASTGQAPSGFGGETLQGAFRIR